MSIGSVFQVTRSNRRLVGRLEHNENVLDALRELMRAHDVNAGALRGSGTMENAVIAILGTDAGANQTRSGDSHVLSLQGRVVMVNNDPVVEVLVVVAHAGQMLGGRLVSGTAKSLDLVINCWDDGTTPKRANLPEESRNMPLEVSPTHTEPSEPRPPVAMPTRIEAAEGSVADPEPGDLLIHPSFGSVSFESEGDSGRVRIKLASGSTREIMLDVFEVVAREPKGDKRVFELKSRRR